MKFEHFKSSVIKGVAYDISKHTLEVNFKNGLIYKYFNVPEKLYNEFKLTESKARFFNLSIKGSFKEERINWI